MRVLVQLRHSQRLHAVASREMALADISPAIETRIAGFVLDPTFSAVQVPAPRPMQRGASPFALGQPLSFSFEPAESTYLVRGQIPDAPARQSETLASANSNPNVRGIF